MEHILPINDFIVNLLSSDIDKRFSNVTDILIQLFSSKQLALSSSFIDQNTSAL